MKPITTPTERRYDNTDLQIVNSGFQVLFDLIILVLPIPIIFKTKFRSKARGMFIYCHIQKAPLSESLLTQKNQLASLSSIYYPSSTWLWQLSGLTWSSSSQSLPISSKLLQIASDTPIGASSRSWLPSCAPTCLRCLRFCASLAMSRRAAHRLLSLISTIRRHFRRHRHSPTCYATGSTNPCVPLVSPRAAAVMVHLAVTAANDRPPTSTRRRTCPTFRMLLIFHRLSRAAAVAPAPAPVPAPTRPASPRPRRPRQWRITADLIPG